MRNDVAYAARVAAYKADPDLKVANSEYMRIVAESRRAAEAAADEAFRSYVPVEIPLKERTCVRIQNIGDATEKDLRALCDEFGYVHLIRMHVNAETRMSASVTFASHPQAADALARLDGAEHFGTTLKTSWAATHTQAVRQIPYAWVYENTPAVRAAKDQLSAAMNAARDRQQPGIVAAEAAEQAIIDAEEAAEEEEERREQYLRDKAEDEAAEREQKEFDEDERQRRVQAYYDRMEEHYEW
jgi:hypothetical protein